MSEVDFSQDLKDFEAEIIQFIIKSQLLIVEKSSTAEILSYFITRKRLTQSEIKELTGLSRGTISQELNNLIERNVIQETNPNNSKIIVYSMESVTLGFINSYLHSIKDYLKYKKRFIRIQKDLESKKEQFQQFDEFNGIYQLTSLYLRAFPVIESVIEKLYEKREQLERQIEQD